MSDYEALQIFNRQRVNIDMIHFLSELTTYIIKKVKVREGICSSKIPALTKFISTLVNNSRVGTSILMSTTIYLNRLKKILPDNIIGMETTRHRLFLGCLIIAAKTLNDNSPMNKHWSKHSNYLLSNDEINTVERELLVYLKWNVIFTTKELILCLKERFLVPIRLQMYKDIQTISLMNSSVCYSKPKTHMKTDIYHHQQYKKSHSNSMDSISSIVSKDSVDSCSSNASSVFSSNDKQNILTSHSQSQIYITKSPSKGPILRHIL